MKVSPETGEVLDWSTQSIASAPEARTVRPLRECRDHDEVLDFCGISDTSAGKLRMSSHALGVLMGTDLSKDQIVKFHLMCELIVARNIVLEESRDIADYLSIRINNLPKLLAAFTRNGLMRFYKRNVTKRGKHLILMNPTLAWRGRFHAGGMDYFNGGVHFSEAHATEERHRIAIMEWIDQCIVASVKKSDATNGQSVPD